MNQIELEIDSSRALQNIRGNGSPKPWPRMVVPSQDLVVIFCSTGNGGLQGTPEEDSTEDSEKKVESNDRNDRIEEERRREGIEKLAKILFGRFRVGF